MMDRLLPWRSKPSKEAHTIFESLGDVRLYVVHRAGPTAFHLQDNSEGPVIKVVLGGKHTCSCKADQTSEVCIHIAFALVRVLKVSPENPLAWQLGLADRELESVLSCSILGDKTKHSKRSLPRVNRGQVLRKPLSEEDPCPICFEDMQKCALRDLVYCRSGCGKNVHGNCLRIWSEHQRSKNAQLSCPLCRTDWGDFRWVALSQSCRAGRSGSSQKTESQCSNCKVTSKGFHCLTCRSYRLCTSCFEAGHHMKHKFARDSDPLEHEILREDMMPCCTAMLDGEYSLMPTVEHITTELLDMASKPNSAPQKASMVFGLGGVRKQVQARGLTSRKNSHPDSAAMRKLHEKADSLDAHAISIFGAKCSIHRAGE